MDAEEASVPGFTIFGLLFASTDFLLSAGLPHCRFVLAYLRIQNDIDCCCAAELHAQGELRRNASPTYAP